MSWMPQKWFAILPNVLYEVQMTRAHLIKMLFFFQTLSESVWKIIVLVKQVRCSGAEGQASGMQGKLLFLTQLLRSIHLINETCSCKSNAPWVRVKSEGKGESTKFHVIQVVRRGFLLTVLSISIISLSCILAACFLFSVPFLLPLTLSWISGLKMYQHFWYLGITWEAGEMWKAQHFK